MAKGGLQVGPFEKILFRLIFFILGGVGLLGLGICVGAKFPEWRKLLAVLLAFAGIAMVVYAFVSFNELFQPCTAWPK
jgi:hypothetical protein